MEILMPQCANETTQTTISATLTTSFLIFSKNIHAYDVYRLQHEQPVCRFNSKALISLRTNETTQRTIFSTDRKNALTLKTTYTTSFS